MKIDFNKIDETIIPAFKGGEMETAATWRIRGIAGILNVLFKTFSQVARQC